MENRQKWDLTRRDFLFVFFLFCFVYFAGNRRARRVFKTGNDRAAHEEIEHEDGNCEIYMIGNSITHSEKLSHFERSWIIRIPAAGRQRGRNISKTMPTFFVFADIYTLWKRMIFRQTVKQPLWVFFCLFFSFNNNQKSCSKIGLIFIRFLCSSFHLRCRNGGALFKKFKKKQSAPLDEHGEKFVMQEEN